MMRKLAMAALAVAYLASTTPTFAQTASAGCLAVTDAASTAAQTEITMLRTNVRKPRSVTGLTCLTALTSISTLSADVIVRSFADQILGQIISQVCNALNNYWQGILNELKCGLTISGLGFGFGLGGGTICHFNINLGGGYGQAINATAGINADGGGYYINGDVNDIQPYGR